MEAYIPQLLITIPALPLAAAAIVAVLGKRVLRQQSHWPVVLALLGSCAASIALIFAVQQAAKDQSEHFVRLWTWATVDPSFRVDIVLRADSLTAIMLGMVTFISTLVAIYSIGYMHGDEGYWRFFAYVSLFVFSMTMLVSVSNFAMLYVFWEAVGLCSYLLIGFWFEKPSAAAAGMKAFLVTRVGDCGFALGVFLIWTTFSTLDFHDSKVLTAGPPGGAVVRTTVYVDPANVANKNLPGTVEHGIFGQWRMQHPYAKSGVVTAICLLLLAGACGKSAAVPAARLVARRHGRSHARQRPDPRSDDGHRRRLHGGPLHAALSRLGNRAGHGGGHRRLHRPFCRADRADAV